MKKTKLLSFAAAILLLAGSVNFANAAETVNAATDTDVVASATQFTAGRRGKGSNGQQFANTNENAGDAAQAPQGRGKKQKSNGNMFKQSRNGSKSIAAFFSADIDNASNLTAEEKTLLKADQAEAQPLYAELEALRTQIQADTRKLRTLTEGSAEYDTLLASIQEQKTKTQNVQTQIIAVFNENANVGSKIGLISPLGTGSKYIDGNKNAVPSDDNVQTPTDTNSTATPRKQKRR